MVATRELMVGVVLLFCAFGGNCNDSDSGAAFQSQSCSASMGGFTCEADAQCNDGSFCNGRERCVGIGEEGADRCGCAAGVPPCRDSENPFCVEETGECESACSGAADADGDGELGVGCGGGDCDDFDPERSSNFLEVCDADGVDEDCDPNTVGERDNDGDGFIDAACRNGLVSGLDCDDNNGAVYIGQNEVCNGVDDDCDGATDEGATVPMYVDSDNDGFGQMGATVMQVCAGTLGFAVSDGDCDDTNPAIQPGAMRCVGGQGNFEICQSNGAWGGGGLCPQGCNPQPNGTGICN